MRVESVFVVDTLDVTRNGTFRLTAHAPRPRSIEMTNQQRVKSQHGLHSSRSDELIMNKLVGVQILSQMTS